MAWRCLSTKHHMQKPMEVAGAALLQVLLCACISATNQGRSHPAPAFPTRNLQPDNCRIEPQPDEDVPGDGEVQLLSTEDLEALKYHSPFTPLSISGVPKPTEGLLWTLSTLRATNILDGAPCLTTSPSAMRCGVSCAGHHVCSGPLFRGLSKAAAVISALLDAVQQAASNMDIEEDYYYQQHHKRGVALTVWCQAASCSASSCFLLTCPAHHAIVPLHVEVCDPDPPTLMACRPVPGCYTELRLKCVPFNRLAACMLFRIPDHRGHIHLKFCRMCAVISSWCCLQADL